MSRSNCDRKHAGLTLLELVVVLSILAIVAGVTIQSLEPIVDQSKYDATRETLKAVEKAIYSEERISTDRMVLRGFVADMGRLPVAIGDDPAFQAQELWNSNASVGTATTYQTIQMDDPEIAHVTGVPVTAGWNGPYLTGLRSTGTPTQPALLDGWGRPFRFGPAGSFIAQGTAITSLLSVGSDGIHDIHPGAGGAVYSNDVQSEINDFSAFVQAQLHVELFDLINGNLVPAARNTGEDFYVLVYGPRDGHPQRVFPPLGMPIDPANFRTLAPFALQVAPAFLTSGPKTIVALLATGNWPNLNPVWQQTKVVDLLPQLNRIDFVRPVASGPPTGSPTTPPSNTPTP